ncbi:hypothetical protein T05_15694 [Trichinella murrelli]|uniref:Uncharacterized protein n=1 Tax=Trichinella murrelli TaxID=144512 RepID=A0A0V0SKY8_9BILA|nr:hypothetical protein T05_15694 [Trichinella murrelli]
MTIPQQWCWCSDVTGQTANGTKARIASNFMTYNRCAKRNEE